MFFYPFFLKPIYLLMTPILSFLFTFFLSQYIEFRTRYIELTTRYIELITRYIELTTQYIELSQLDIFRDVSSTYCLFFT